MDINIPLVDLAAQWAVIGREAEPRIREVLGRGDFILGRALEEFEAAFAAYCGCRRAIGVASGLDALKLALRALDVGPGDTVIVPAHTFIATALAVSAVGAQPALVDIDEASFNLDPRRLEEAAGPRTRAVIPVHLYGRPADMDPILELAARRGWAVLEDAAQAHGARYRGRPCGSLGRIAAFSFYPGKNLGAAGDGGAVTTNEAALADRVARLRNYGSTVKYRHDELGENSRLDTLQAAILSVKLRHLDEWNAARRQIAAAYTDALRGVGDLLLPAEPADAESVWHLYVVRTSRRDALLDHLRTRGIGALIHYPCPIHLQPAYAGAGWRAGQFPVAERVAREVISLPIYPEMSEEQIARVVSAVREFYG